MNDNPVANKEQLKTEIEEYRKDIEGRGKRHSRGNTTLILSSILISAAITIVGIFDLGRAAAIFGVTLAALLAVREAFPLGEMAFFYRASLADLAVLEDSLTYLDSDMGKVVERFGIIKKHVAKNVPRGNASEAIQSMRDEVSKIE